jgi:acylglycerol lipase
MSVDITVKYARLPNGLVYHYQHWIPQDPIALVVIVHGLGDHIGRFGKLVQRLTAEGLACALYDQRGHGRSQGRRGHVERFMDWVDDLASFVHFSASMVPEGLPAFILGHSLGGLIGINYLLVHALPIDGMVAVAPALRPTVRVPAWKIKWYARLARFFPEVAVANGIRFSDITNDPDAVAALAKDPLFHQRLTLWGGLEILRNLERLHEYPHRIHVPMLVLTGSEDRVVDPRETERFFEQLASEDKQYRCYPGMYHDLFHDVGGGEVLDEIALWIADRARHAAPRDRQYHLHRRETIWEDASLPTR